MSNMSYEQKRRVAYSLYGPRDSSTTSTTTSSTASCPLAAHDHLAASVEMRVHVTVPVASGPDGQMDLLAWVAPAPKPRRYVQLDLFGIDLHVAPGGSADDC